MKKTNKLITALLIGSLTLPVWAVAQKNLQIPPQESAIELTPQDLSSGNWKHIGDLSLSNQIGTEEELVAEAQKQASMKGAKYFKVTRMQLMENSSWSTNIALYNPAKKAAN